MTLGADKGYDRKEFVRELRDHNVPPHIAQKQWSAVVRHTSRQAGYAFSQTKRKRGHQGLVRVRRVAFAEAHMNEVPCKTG